MGLKDLVHPEAVIGALNYLNDLAFTSLTLTVIETCGPNTLTLITARKLKRLKMLKHQVKRNVLKWNTDLNTHYCYSYLIIMQ